MSPVFQVTLVKVLKNRNSEQLFFKKIYYDFYDNFKIASTLNNANFPTKKRPVIE
jgi:hypothetical protein